MMEITGNIVDLVHNRIFFGTLFFENGKITSIKEKGPIDLTAFFILPGFIDAHVHIESSMLIPTEFARMAVKHGTVATVSDPHEIANVLGMKGVRYMIENGKKVPFHFYFGASSCVPATSFETAGSTLTDQDIKELFVKDSLHYLSEMMNYPGVIHHDPVVMQKIKVAHELKKPVDGHAPGLRGDDLRKYIAAGIFTDHECFTLEEAEEKLSLGMKILIREGSAAKNYDALHPVIKKDPKNVMFCSDDKHPHELIKSHINALVKRSIELGYDTLDVLRCASLNPVRHYNLQVGLLQKNDGADFIVVDNLNDFTIKQVFIKGIKVSENGRALFPYQKEVILNNFSTTLKKSQDFKIKDQGLPVKVIKALEGQLITEKMAATLPVKEGYLESDVGQDILKIVVVNRYNDAFPAIAFIHNFGLKKGAIASSVAHDSHNIIAVGVTDDAICKAINALIMSKGGIAVVDETFEEHLSLPVAGLMSNEEGEKISEKYILLDQKAKELGSQLSAPFMTLSFMALLVIPSLKLSDKGLFDVDSFQFTNLFVDDTNNVVAKKT
jgi:adenine deaminase